MSSFKHWIFAIRPRTLTLSISPVLIACALAYADGVFKLIPALLCALVAELAQVGSNLANDYYDYKKGGDTTDRLGPARAVSSGWISPEAMLKAVKLVFAAAFMIGLSLVHYGGWWIILIAVVIILAALAYSAGPLPFSRNGLGDLLVLIFYGWVPVCFTYYIQAGGFSLESFVLSFIPGLLSINVLVVNNYRDYIQDKNNKKYTTVVIFGRRAAEIAYFLNGAVSIAIAAYCLSKTFWAFAGYAAYAVIFLRGFIMLLKKDGRELNPVLGYTAANVFVFSLIVSAIILFQ